VTTFNLPAPENTTRMDDANLSPDGRYIAFRATPKGSSVPLLYVRSLDTLAPRVLKGTEEGRVSIWSPDGRLLAFQADGKLKKISLDGSSAVTLCDAPFGRGGSWNRDGVMIFAPASHGGIYKIPDSGGVPTPVTNVNTSIHTTHRWPKFLPFA
jgi:serine/threonine-protein kinase